MATNPQGQRVDRRHGPWQIVKGRVIKSGRVGAALIAGGRMHRIIITGANGAGKSHLAARLGGAVSYDAIKLTKDWVQRPRKEIDAALAEVVAQDKWIIEGGPSLLPTALPRAEAVIWLDPPVWRRAWRLAKRPWQHRGTTRTELPEGNVDRVLPQYLFGWRSLRRDQIFRAEISKALAGTSAPVLQCRSAADINAAIRKVNASAGR